MTEELLAALLQHFLDSNKLLKKEITSIRSAKASTREEIYKRLSMATDHIHSYYAQDITLDELAGRACMSKFHFLRLFKEVLGRTPYQYIASVRLAKAAGLLRSTTLTAAEISWMVGYEDPTSFNRAFYNFHKYRPQAYREMAK
jgi:AraC family transcriptional regulator